MKVRQPNLRTDPASVDLPARRRHGLSPAERFWIILGTVGSMLLVPVAGIAVLPDPARSGGDDDGPIQARVAAARQASGAAQAEAEVPNPAPVAVAAIAQSTASGQQSGTGGTPPDNSQPDQPPPGDSSHDSIRSTTGDSLNLAGLVSAGSPRSETAQLMTSQPVAATVSIDAMAVFPTGTEGPPVAVVTAFGSDPDTWGVQASYLIVSRPQDHMVQTADGVLHMVINRGLGEGLVLVSSDDGGATWDSVFRFGFGNPLSTSDIRLIDGQDMMIVSYLNGGNNVAFAMFAYDPMTGLWTEIAGSVVDRDLDAPDTVHPTVVLAPDGTILIAYTDEVEGGLRVVLQQSFDNGLTWTETVLSQPGVDIGSARAIAVGDTEGVIYSNSDTMYWLTWDDSGVWHMEVIDPAGTVGSFASHFSSITLDDVVIVANVGSDLVLRVMWLDGATGDWSEAVLPTGRMPVTNVQISISDDTGFIYVTFDDVSSPGGLVVMESRDGGKTWDLEALVQTPADMVSPPTRFEAPEHFSGDLVITMQVLAPGEAEGLYVHSIDVDGPEAPLPPDQASPNTDDFLF
jgi:hypothetical protein